MNQLKRVLVLCTIVSLVAVLGVWGFAQAQDTTPGSVQCDDDLILNLYIAQRFFGFNQVRDAFTASGMDTSGMSDLTVFDYGQYGPWFDMNMSTTSNPVWSDDQVNAVTGLWMLDDETLGSTISAGIDTSAITSLPASGSADEDAACSQLRAELNRFFRIVAYHDINSGMMGSLPGSADVTPEAGMDSGEATPEMTSDGSDTGGEATPEATP
jgi:hypothetical protein